jgi:hypothetical protein
MVQLHSGPAASKGLSETLIIGRQNNGQKAI